MTVKPVRSAERVLATLEALAENQPIGVGALARVLDDDKSAVQRALVTLAHAGWIRPAAGDQARWELSTRALVVAEHAQRRSGLLQQLRGTVVALAQETGETVTVSTPDVGRIVIVDVVESRHLVRTVPLVGMVISPFTSAAGQAIVAAMTDADRDQFLGAPPPPAVAVEYADIRARGWSLNEGDGAEQGSTSVGAAVISPDGRPVAAIAVAAVSDRMPPVVQHRLGARVAEVARALSVDGVSATAD